jgi:hypothetical protein
MAALDALRRILKAAEQVDRLKGSLDQAEQELAAALASRDAAQQKAQTLRARLVIAKNDFAALIEAELPELKQ